MSRDLTIDTARGMASLVVVLVHCAMFLPIPLVYWHSILVFGVPAFFFMSGMTLRAHSNIITGIKGLLVIYIKYAIFISVVYIIHAIYQGGSIDEYTNWLKINYPNGSQPFSTFFWSLWFLPVYFIFMLMAIYTLLLGSFVRWVLIAGCLVYIIGGYPLPELLSFVSNSNSTILCTHVLYFTLLLLGMQTYPMKLNDRHFLLLGAILLGLLIIFSPYAIVSPSYFFYSLIPVLCILWMRSKQIVIKPLAWLGHKAIWMFLSQAIATSLLLYIIDYTNLLYSPVQLVLHFTLATAMSVAISYGFAKLWKRIPQLLSERFSHGKLMGACDHQ